jgi:aminopeptidase N
MVLSLAGAPALVQGQEATPVGCSAGSSGIGDGYFPTMGNAGYDVRHYDLELDLDVDANEIVAATTTIDALAVLDLCTFNLDFRGLEIDEVMVDGQAAGYERVGAELTIMPARPIASGSAFTVVVAYHGTPHTQSVELLQARAARLAGDNGAPATPGAEAGPVATPIEEVVFAEEIGEALLVAEIGEAIFVEEIAPDVVAPEAWATPGAAEAAAAEEEPPLLGGWWAPPGAVFVAGQPRVATDWFPVNEHPADKATYRLQITVPKPYAVVANGTPAEPIDEEDARTFTWSSRDPMASYLVTFHAAELEVEESTGPNGLPIRLAFAPAVSEEERAIYRRLPEMLAYFETVFGPYPFESAGATVVGLRIRFALETQTLPIFPIGNPTTPQHRDRIEQVLVHELAHQWCGDLVSVLRWRDIWLNEGCANYAQALWREHTGGPAARDQQLARTYQALRTKEPFRDPAIVATLTAKDVLDAVEQVRPPLSSEERQRYLAALGATSEEELATIPAERGIAALPNVPVRPALFPGIAALTGNPGAAQMFSADAVYGRGGLTLHALRREVGDETFFAILREWTARYRNGNAETADFVALAEEVSGRELDDLFDKWLFKLRLPELTFEHAPVGTPAATPAA